MLSSKWPRRDPNRGLQIDIAPAARPNDAGNAKMPDPTIDPITSAMSAVRESV